MCLQAVELGEDQPWSGQDRHDPEAPVLAHRGAAWLCGDRHLQEHRGETVMVPDAAGPQGVLWHLLHDGPFVSQLAQLSMEGDVAPWGRIMGDRRAVFFTWSHHSDQVWRGTR